MPQQFSLKLRRRSRSSRAPRIDRLRHRLHRTDTVARGKTPRNTGLRERRLDRDVAHGRQLQAELLCKRTLELGLRFMRQEAFGLVRAILELDDDLSALGTLDEFSDLACVDVDLGRRFQLRRQVFGELDVAVRVDGHFGRHAQALAGKMEDGYHGAHVSDGEDSG